MAKESLIPADKLFFDLVLDAKKYLKDNGPDELIVDNEEYVMSYNNYKHIRKHIVPTELLKYYDSLNFLLFPKNSKGFIVVDDFLRSLQRLIDVDKLCIHLLSYSIKNRIYIYENEVLTYLFTHIYSHNCSNHLCIQVERYIYDLISAREISACQNIDKELYIFYVYTVVKCIFFYLDSHRSQRISISKLAHSSIMEDLLYLIRMSDQGSPLYLFIYYLVPFTHPLTFQDDIPNNNADENDILSPPIEFNWFSGANTIRLYQEFLFLDQDKNGTQIKYSLILITYIPFNM